MIRTLREGIPEGLKKELHGLYKALHANPELSMCETKTSATIFREMTNIGFEVFGCGGTGIVAYLANGSGPVVGFRADIDGLPVAEDTGLEYASDAMGQLDDGTRVPVMHACGHDTHITCAIGAARLLKDSASEWAGTVVFVFQPGEETAQGARAMLSDNLWNRAPNPDVMFAQHVSPETAGTIDVSVGPGGSIACSLRITVMGRGGHGSEPQNAIDPIVLAAYMVVRLQSIVGREVSPQDAAVVSVGSFHSGLKENIIPSSAEFTVNLRSLTQSTHELLIQSVKRIVDSEAAASGAPVPEIETISEYPLLYNDDQLTEKAMSVLRATVGDKNVGASYPVLGSEESIMGSEDFGYLPGALGIPATYWDFGSAKGAEEGDDASAPPNHSPKFAPVLEPTLSTGVLAAYNVIRSELK